MPTVVLSNPLEAHYAERLGLVVRDYEVGEAIVLDTVTAQFLEYVGYGIVTADPVPGAPLRFGSGVPAANLGANGDYYLDTTAQRVYGPKVGGSWGAGVPLTDSNVLIGGIIVAPEGPQGDPGDKGDKGDPGDITNLQLRGATDYDNTTAPQTGQLIRWNGTKFAPYSVGASDVGAVSLLGDQTVAGTKTFSSSPVVPAPSSAGHPVRHDDTRLSNARTPTAHAASHAAGQPDALTPDAILAAPIVHTHPSGAITDLTETVQDIVAAFVVAGSNVVATYDDVANTFTIDATAGGTATTDPEVVRDVIGAALVAGAGIQVTLNDAGDTITIASTAVLPTRQVASGTGLTGGGDLSADRTLAVTYGTAAGTAAQGNDSRIVGAVQTSRTITAGTGLTGGGDLSANRSLAVAYGTTAGTAAQGNDTRIVNAVQGSGTGATVVLTQAAYDALATKVATTLYVIQG